MSVRFVRQVAYGVLLGGTLVGCTRPSATNETVGARVVEQTVKAQPRPVVVAPPLVVPAPSPPPPYAEAVRKREFDRAASLLDVASSDEKALPEWLYARAFVAKELGRTAEALELLTELEKNPRGFEKECAALRERVIIESENVELLKSGSPANRAQHAYALAEALLQEDRVKDAITEARQALSAKSIKTNPLELTARLHEVLGRALVSEGAPNLAAREYLWLALEAPALDLSKGALARALELDPALRPKARDILARAEKLAEAGAVAELEGTLTWLRRAKPPTPEYTLIALEARSLYQSKSDYPKAAELYRKAVSGGGPRQDEYRYFEAKSLARANQNADALARYGKLAKRSGIYAEHAAYQLARLSLNAGNYEDSVRYYESYEKRFRKGSHVGEIANELPLALLGRKSYARAETKFRALLAGKRQPLERAFYLELIALCLEGAEKTAQALDVYRSATRERPLSLPALLAEAHLAAHGESAPALTTAETVGILPLVSLTLPVKVERLGRVGLDEQAEAALKDSESELRREYGERAGEALCELYGRLESGRRRYQIAQTAASAKILRYELTSETRWQAECLFPRPYAETVEQNAETFGVAPSFVYGVMRQESAFHPGAVSPAAAVGLMQIIPPTAEKIALELGAPLSAGELRSPYVNIRFGSFYLKKLLDTFQGRTELAAAAYNAGPSAVFRWLKEKEEEPTELFVAKIPYDETRTYVLRVVENTARYAYLLGGKDAVTKPELKTPINLVRPEVLY